MAGKERTSGAGKERTSRGTTKGTKLSVVTLNRPSSASGVPRPYSLSVSKPKSQVGATICLG